MIKLTVSHTGISTAGSEKLVVGNVNSIFIQFFFSPEWESLTRVAVFTNGETRCSVPLNSDRCIIPWEVLSEVGELFVALRGIDDGGNFVLCTENEFLGIVHRSGAVCIADESEPPTPNVIDSLLADVAVLNEALAAGGIGWTEGSGATVTWDGDTTGRDYIELYGEPSLYKVSDDVFPFADFVSMTGVDDHGDPVTLLQEEITEFSSEQDGLFFGVYVVSGLAGDYSVSAFDEEYAITIPTDGTYLYNGQEGVWFSSVTYGSEVVHEIDPKFLSEVSGGTWGGISGDIADQTDLQAALDTKVDKVTGKGLSTNDFTDAYKARLDSTFTSLAGYATESYVNAHHDSTKQDVIPENTYDAYGAAAGVQTDLAAHTGNADIHVTAAKKAAWDAKSDFSGSYDDLTDKPEIPEEYDDTVLKGRVSAIEAKEAGWDAKQDAISDLATIRSGAALGATALQEHQSLAAYRTANAQDAIDAGKADKATTYTKTEADAAISAHHDSTKLDANQGAVNVGKIMGIDEDGDVVPVDAPSGGTWGEITGTLADQTDLQAALDAKSDFSGSYNDLTDKPAIPTALSQLTADATHRLVSDTEKSTWNGKVDKTAISSTYTDTPSKDKVASEFYVAQAQQNIVMVLARSNNEEFGTVAGTGLYKKNSTVRLTATAVGQGQLVRWRDDATDETLGTNATLDVIITKNMSITALFSDGQPIVVKPWATATDAELASAIQAAYDGFITLSDYWSIGDTRTVHLSATEADGVLGIEAHAEQDVQFTIMDFTCTGFTLSDGTGKPKMIVGLKDGLFETGQMNSSGTNTGGWKDCKRRKWCNNQFYNSLPSVFRSLFKQFEWQCVQSGADGTLNTVQDYFALPPEKAVFGQKKNSRQEEADMFELWSYYNTTTNRIKHQGIGGSASNWWECSPGPDRSSYFCYVGTGGTNGQMFADTFYFIAPFGCV